MVYTQTTQERDQEVQELLDIYATNVRGNIGVLLNQNYGGWRLSTDAQDVLRRLLPDTYPLLVQEISSGMEVSRAFRTNPIVGGLFFKMKDADQSFSPDDSIDCEYVGTQYAGFFKITEYDGMETLKINKKAFRYSVQLETVRKQLAAAQAEIAAMRDTITPAEISVPAE